MDIVEYLESILLEGYVFLLKVDTFPNSVNPRICKTTKSKTYMLYLDLSLMTPIIFQI